jgi:hypothetical protein
MGAHTQLGGISESEQVQGRQLAKGDSEIGNPVEQESGLKQFKTRIVPTPLAEQCNALAYFPNVRIVPTPRHDKGGTK